MYTHHPIPQRERASFSWPDGSPLAIVPVVLAETWSVGGPKLYAGGPPILPAPIPPQMFDFPNWTWREYGKQVGIWRFLDELGRMEVPVSVGINGLYLETERATVAAMQAAGWDLSCCHGYIEDTCLLEFVNDAQGHRGYIEKSLDAHSAALGTPARGWMSPAAGFLPETFDVLGEGGVVDWVTGFLNDDSPFWIEAGGRHLVGVPYNTELNDYTVFTRGGLLDDAQYVAAILRYVTRLRAEAEATGVARVATIPMHPHVLGQAFRIHLIEQLYTELKKLDGVWWTTQNAVAEHFASVVPRP